MPKCEHKCKTCPKRSMCLSKPTPNRFGGDCSLPEMSLTFVLQGRVCNIPVGTVISLQYTRTCAPNTAVSIGDTVVGSDGTFTFNIVNLIVPNPLLGDVNLFVQALSGQEILAFAYARLKIACSGPKRPYICCPKKCKSKCKC